MRTVTFRVHFEGERGKLTSPNLKMDVSDQFTFPTSVVNSEITDLLAMVVDTDVNWTVEFIHST